MTKIFHRSIAFIISAAAAWAAPAQTVYVTGIEGDKMSADIEQMGGATVTGVVTRTFYMPTGESTALTDYRMVAPSHIEATLDLKQGDYFYRMEVTFSNGNTVKTDCFNAAYTQAAVWLSDLTPTATTGNPVFNDVCCNGAPILIDGVTYYKGVSAQAVSAAEYILPRTFDYMQFTMGVQDCLADGSASTGYARIINSVNGAETNWKGNMYAKTNPSRGNTVCKFIARYPAGTATMAINKFKFNFNDVNANTTHDFCNLGAIRLYSAIPKMPQTVEFETVGGYIPDNVESVDLKATASRGTAVTYTIVQGADIATIVDGNRLAPNPGCRGTITVEALAAGTDRIESASALVSFRINRAATVQYLDTYIHPDNPESQTVYLYVDPKDRSLEELSIDIYDDARSFIKQGTLNPGQSLKAYATHLPNVYAIVTPAGFVHQLKYRFSGDEETVVEPYAEGLNQFKYMSDMPYKLVTGYGTGVVDAPYSGSVGKRIENKKYSYTKGFGFHAANNQTGAYVQTEGDISDFDRFVVDVGGQVVTNTARGKLSFALYDGTSLLTSTGNVAWTEVAEWDMPVSGMNVVKIVAGNGGDNNQNDVVAVGAPRFYYRQQAKETQSVEWPSTQVKIDYYKPFSLPLQATASSGLPVVYYVAEGAEYAHIVDGNTLQFDKLITGGDVVVEAFQPGDKIYGPAAPVQCRFAVTDRLIVNRDERIQIDGNQDLDELVVYADALSAGQVVVKDGVAHVKKLVVKYTFVPGEWNFLCFPSNANLDEISDLNEKGYYLNGSQPDAGSYELQSYNSRTRAHTPSNSPWDAMTSANVSAQVGYIFRLDDSHGAEPQEITFTITNVSLDLDSGLGLLHLTLDLNHSDPGSLQTVYVKPANVNGNILRVNVLFRPSDESLLPVNHAKALEAMRVTYTADRKGIRLTLPDQTPARVGLFSADGSELVKAVRYVSPMVMNVADVPAGSYQLVVTYGAASTVRNIEL